MRQGGKPMTGDPACFLFHKNDVLVGFAVIHVDDIIISGTQELVNRVVGAIKRRFKVSKRSTGNLHLHRHGNQI